MCHMSRESEDRIPLFFSSRFPTVNDSRCSFLYNSPICFLAIYYAFYIFNCCRSITFSWIERNEQSSFNHQRFEDIGLISLEVSFFLLRRSTNRSIFWLVQKSGNTDEPIRVPSMKTNASRKKFFWLSKARLVFNAKITNLEMSKLFPTWFISWSIVTINFHEHSMRFSCTFLPIKAGK